MYFEVKFRTDADMCLVIEAPDEETARKKAEERLDNMTDAEFTDKALSAVWDSGLVVTDIFETEF